MSEENRTKEITFNIYRFDPCRNLKPRTVEYTVPVHEGAMVLDVLKAVRDKIDPTLSIRYCCSAGQCGSCAVRINGRPGLACMTEAVSGMTIEPLDLPVIKDLVVDLTTFLREMPGLVPSECTVLPSRGDVDKIRELRDCIECLCCVSVCPAMDVAEFDGPLTMRQEMRLALDPRNADDRLKVCVEEEGLFKCTSCQACADVCPKKISIPGKAIEKLRELAAHEGLYLKRHREVAELVETTGRSVERSGDTFMEQVPEIIEPYGEVKAEIGFFVGCMYNMRVVQTALDTIEVLKRNGIRVIIPKKQVCCGSPLIRTGNTKIVPELMKKNIECFRERGIKTVMTMCAGCGSTLKNDYMDKPFEVLDINEVLLKYGIEEPEKLDLKVTYHDPCHLIRGQGISEEPRKLISLFASEFIEMPNKCCGSGGGVRAGYPEEAASLGRERHNEIVKTGCDVVVTSCPFCEYHIQSCTDRPVRNINSLILEGYRKKDQKKKGK
ncbi:succinate dehydrogenase/fumarate reductase iron-sulfur subunit [Methanoplanus sp. FWC-SCC4]|uniref:Succinate dehydrogenase/fumarate reductase iron-sulfur subunit n=1 Tax=Methanochimaera problematica TaxID=2609417 RepID=A0AA97I1J0_9EURY|nr:fumarate reductase (CoM/CoB) subunit TfrB [Methanoplanus sp. FWC-SCC4]WOF15210.1 succinate dehydrogenase/fumarate reductase iron-sulfur subunit [Methanoplanus sp. FWC-SCC4]